MFYSKGSKEIHQDGDHILSHKITVESSIPSNKNVVEDFEHTLSDTQNLPKITIVKVIEPVQQISPSINLTALTPHYSLSKQDRRLRGLVFRKFRGGTSETWSVYNEVIDKRGSNEVTLIVVGEGWYDVHSFVDVWSEYLYYHSFT